MYCPDCREERRGKDFWCALCGARMTERSREVIEAELTHVQFLLDELTRWEPSEVPPNVRRFISERYERQTRILLAVLTEMPAGGPVQVPAVGASRVGGELADATARADVGALSAQVFEPVARSEGAALVPSEIAASEPSNTAALCAEVPRGPSEDAAPNLGSASGALAAGMEVPFHAATPAIVRAASGVPAGGMDVPFRAVNSTSVGAASGGPMGGMDVPLHAAGRAQSHAELPPNPAEPYAEPPPAEGAFARFAEETSTWNRVWRPFLYESIMWFVGAFLILSGTLYFVFESWAGMSSNVRSFTVFGLTAGYSAGFSIWGAYLARREALRSAGNILGLIGSAVAPLAGIALGPMGLGEAFQLGGVGTVLLIPLLLAWAGVSAFLARKPAEHFDEASRPIVQVSLVASTLMMGLAPLAARAGVFALGLHILPCALFFLLSSRSTPQPRPSTSLVFALAAPLYFLALYFMRLHVALEGAGVELSVGTYAPFAAFLLATSLRFRALAPERGADALSIGVVSLQALCLAAAALAPPPAFFLTAAVVSWSLLSLARGGIARIPWVYGAYASTYLSYASFSQLIPGPVKRLINALKVRLGYDVTDALPVQFGALSALPYIFAGAVLGIACLWRGERTGAARERALAELLFRATAVASPLFVFLGMTGPDARPAFWSVLALALLCLVVGLLVERFFLSVVGAALAMLLPFHAWSLLGAPAASVVAGALALGLAVVVTLCSERTRWLLGVAAGVLSVVGFLLGMVSRGGAVSVVGVALCGAAAMVVAWALQRASLMAVASVLAVSVLPRLVSEFSGASVALAMSVASLVLASLGTRGGLWRWLGRPAVGYAVLAVLRGALGEVTGLAGVILIAAGAVAVASKTVPRVRPLAIVLAALVLVRDDPGFFAPWGGWMTPGLSVALFACWALGASLVASWRGRSLDTQVAGVVALVFPLYTLAVDDSSGRTFLLLGAALAALLTLRALPAWLSVAVAAYHATAGLMRVGPEALLGLSVVLAILAVLEAVPMVRRVFAVERRFAWVSTLASMVALLLAILEWTKWELPPLVLGSVALPLLWTRATRRPFVASLAVPYTFGLLALDSMRLMGGRVPFGLVGFDAPPRWAVVLPLLALGLARAVAHLPVVAEWLLGSREEAPRRAVSTWLQGWLAFVALPVVAFALRAESSPLGVCCLAASLALMPGARPFLRVSAAALLLMAFPAVRPAVIPMLLALAILEHWRPAQVWRFFRSPDDPVLRPSAVTLAMLLSVFHLVESFTPVRLVMTSGVLVLAAFLLSQRMWLIPAVWALALAALGMDGIGGFLPPDEDARLRFVLVLLGAATLAAVCQSERIQTALRQRLAKVLPELNGPWSEPLWLGSAIALGLMQLARLLQAGPGALPLLTALGMGLTACVLMVTRERAHACVATALLGMSLVVAAPPSWGPAVVSGVGLVLCLVGMRLDARGVHVGAALHHGGWVLALLALAGIRDLEHVGMPLSILFALGAAWAVVLRRRSRELVGWLATLAAMHGGLMHLGAVYSSGRGAEFILPYFGAASALLATLVLFMARESLRREVGHSFALVALTEVIMGLPLIGASADALREGMVSSVALGALFFALVRRAVKSQESASGYLAQVVLALGYLSVRVLGMGALPGPGDSLAALVGGALFTGLYFFAQREGAGLASLRGPMLLGAYLFPMAGLLSAPWGEPAHMAALLVGHAAHFAALGAHPDRRGMASLVSVVAFNAALLMGWRASGKGELVYFIIPAGLSLLALLRVFRGALLPELYTQLRALAVTGIYVAAAWKPLMFSDGRSMLLCVLLCVVGVVCGIALRIRSYVYLGTGFLVTCIAANLVRFGMRDHRVAAASLFMLGLLVIGTMVMLSAHRATLRQRYARVRALLATWEG
ncbi:hypothetical protein ACLEPN_16315 [Myxococcus sp. 1LA]